MSLHTDIDISEKLLESYSFEFQAQELPQKLSLVCQAPLTGYLLLEFPSICGTDCPNQWYLGISQGQIVFSGHQQLCWQEFLKIFQRFVPRLQNADARHAILALNKRFLQETQQTQSAFLLELLHELQQLNSLTIEQLRAALRLKILADFDTYLFKYPGEAKFLPSSPLDFQTSLLRFDIEDLLSEAKERQVCWHNLHAKIPSMESVPVLNYDTIESANLMSQQKVWLETLTSSGKTLNEIASSLAQDSLEVAKIFANLISNNLVKLKSSTVTSIPEIFVVDDSPLILKQFEKLVTSWGYSVRSFYDPTTALKTLVSSKPAVFCLDINMPGITGFDLVKQIRRQPQLASVPIIMLTAEQTLTNNWRSRWSGCQFLNKPLKPNDIPKFKNELRILLAELLLVNPPN